MLIMKKERFARYTFLMIIFILSFFLISNSVYGAVISGNIYDFSFNLVENTIVEINTEPRQVIVSQDGSYEFQVSPGNYVITARKNGLVSVDNLSVVQEGYFRYDIILLPSFKDDYVLVDALDDVISDSSGLDQFTEIVEDDLKELLLYFMVSFFALVFGLIFAFRKKIRLFFRRIVLNNHKKNKLIETETINVVDPNNVTKHESVPESSNVLENSSDDIDKVINFIKSENGRSTQKDIRKNIPLSEAKISLLISELEHDGKIKKFKKGRSNVIVLK